MMNTCKSSSSWSVKIAITVSNCDRGAGGQYVFHQGSIRSQNCGRRSEDVSIKSLFSYQDAYFTQMKSQQECA